MMMEVRSFCDKSDSNIAEQRGPKRSSCMSGRLRSRLAAYKDNSRFSCEIDKVYKSNMLMVMNNK